MDRIVPPPGGKWRDPSLSINTQSEKRWMKAELHSHCNLDPVDYRSCRYSPEELILRAANLGYEILAITCHNLDIWDEDLASYANGLGITLIPGMEVTAEGTRHTLVYNFGADAADLNTLKKIRARSRDETLVIAPHPFFPGSHCLRGLLQNNLDVFDAIECSGFHVQGMDFNRRGEALAAREHKPLVGNGDIHYLWQLGRTFTWVYSEPGIRPVLNAIKEGLVRVQKSSITWFEAAKWWTASFPSFAFPVNPESGKPSSGKSRPRLRSDKVKDGRCFGPTQESMKP